MNKVMISGRIVRDIDLKATPSGKFVFQNSIAVKNDYKNANGEYDTQFINVVVWGNNAEFISKYAEKGSRILIDGRMATRNYDDKDGKKVYVTEVVAEKVEILDFKKDKSNNDITSEEIEKSRKDVNPYDFNKTESEDPFQEFGNQISIDDNFLD